MIKLIIVLLETTWLEKYLIQIAENCKNQAFSLRVGNLVCQKKKELLEKIVFFKWSISFIVKNIIKHFVNKF